MFLRVNNLSPSLRTAHLLACKFFSIPIVYVLDLLTIQGGGMSYLTVYATSVVFLVNNCTFKCLPDELTRREKNSMGIIWGGKKTGGKLSGFLACSCKTKR